MKIGKDVTTLRSIEEERSAMPFGDATFQATLLGDARAISSVQFLNHIQSFVPSHMPCIHDLCIFCKGLKMTQLKTFSTYKPNEKVGSLCVEKERVYITS